MNPIDTSFASYPQLNEAIAQSTRAKSRAHSVIPQGSLSSPTTNGTGATQSFASILTSIMGGSSK